MLGRKQELNQQFQQIIDGFLIVFAFWLAHVVRFYLHQFLPIERQIPPFSEFRWVLFVLMPFGPLMLEFQGFYTHSLQRPFGRSLGQVLRAGLYLSLLLLVCVFFFKLELPSRLVLPFFGLLAVVLVLLRERLMIHWFKNRSERWHYRERVLLVGVPEDIQALQKSLTPEQQLEMEIVGIIDLESRSVSDLVEALHEHAVSRVILAGAGTHMNRLQEAIAACEIEGVEAWLAADFIKTSIARPDFEVLGNRPMLVFRTTPEFSWELIMKRVVDLIGGLVLLVVLSPMMLATAIAIKLGSPGPAIFRQTRGGKHGKPFVMYKFRTMFTDAEMRHAELSAHNQMKGPVFKIDRDPRVTPLGRWLRKWSIDEFPQLLNVLGGSMSLVGPRPLPMYEVEKFENTAQRRRLSVKPGLTCLWQIGGRNEVADFKQWVKLDLEYIDNWSIWLDFYILIKTIPAVLLGRGAK